MFVRKLIDRLPPWLVRIVCWEYWPLNVLYAPIYGYWLLLAIRARSFTYFSAANPGIPSGGMTGESKGNILRHIPEQYLPKTLVMQAGTDLAECQAQMSLREMDFPVIAKPDVGERGNGVEKITGKEHLKQYLASKKGDFILQEYADLPVEVAVFYYRFPGKEYGRISSITLKEFLSVTGNGHDTIATLARRHVRGRIYTNHLENKLGHRWHDVPAAGEVLLLEPIGNHCRGTAFLDATALADERMASVFDGIAKAIPGFYYGRFDLRCQSLEALRSGESLVVLELNGAGAEPGHIYQPGLPLFKAYRVLFHHWTVMYQISRINHRLGVAYQLPADFIRMWRREPSAYKPKPA